MFVNEALLNLSLDCLELQKMIWRIPQHLFEMYRQYC